MRRSNKEIDEMTGECRMRITAGGVELVLEGPIEVLSDRGPEILRSLLETASAAPPAKPTGGSDGQPGSIQMTTANVAAKLNAKSGQDLIRAACARLALSLGRETFGRREILEEMRSATGYFKESYGKNLSNYLKSAVRDDMLREPSGGTYTLAATARHELEARLA